LSGSGQQSGHVMASRAVLNASLCLSEGRRLRLRLLLMLCRIGWR
jgi:hypothetical protein